jgi:hypothetical protein
LATSQNEICSGCCRWAKHAFILDCEHENRLRKFGTRCTGYLALLERKIGALDQAAPLVGWGLPEECPWMPPQSGKAPCSSSHPSALIRSVYPGKYPLRSDREDLIQVIFASPDLQRDPGIRPPPHPLCLAGGIPSGPS